MPRRRPKPQPKKRSVPAVTILRQYNWTPASARSLLRNNHRGVYINLLAINTRLSHDQVVRALERLARQKK